MNLTISKIEKGLYDNGYRLLAINSCYKKLLVTCGRVLGSVSDVY